MVDMNEFKNFLNSSGGFNNYNHIRFTVVEEGYCECQVELTPDGLNPQKVAHGSLLFLMCDCVTGVASASLGRDMLTLSSNMHYLRPGVSGVLTAKSKKIKVGRTTALFGAEVWDDQGRLLCTGDFEVYYTGRELDWEKR